MTKEEENKIREGYREGYDEAMRTTNSGRKILALVEKAEKETKEKIKTRLEELARQNTYEGDEALVYKTTMEEVLASLKDKNES